MCISSQMMVTIETGQCCPFNVAKQQDIITPSILL